MNFWSPYLILQKNKRSANQLVKYMVDVAMGMHYISERGLVHRVSYRYKSVYTQIDQHQPESAQTNCYLENIVVLNQYTFKVL